MYICRVPSFFFMKKKGIVVLIGTRLNPFFFQEVSSLFVDLIKLLFT